MRAETRTSGVGTAVLLLALLSGALWSSACTTTDAAAPAAATGGRAPLEGARYRIDTPQGWRNVDLGVGEADFQLEADRGASWVIVRSSSGSTLRLDEIVAFRRAAIFDQNEVREYRETRAYHPHGLHVIASTARYLLGSQVLLVMTAVDGTLGVEIAAGTPLGSGRERELLAMFESLRFLEGAPR